jgi:hypothetical protein
VNARHYRHYRYYPGPGRPGGRPPNSTTAKRIPGVERAQFADVADHADLAEMPTTPYRVDASTRLAVCDQRVGRNVEIVFEAIDLRIQTHVLSRPNPAESG